MTRKHIERSVMESVFITVVQRSVMERSDSKTMIDQMFQVQTEKISGIHGPVWKYEWEDDLGLHQYFAEEDSGDCSVPCTEPGLIQNFRCEFKENPRIYSLQDGQFQQVVNYNCENRGNCRVYSWHDGLGFHQHTLCLE